MNNFFLASDPLLNQSATQNPQSEYDMRIAQLEAARNQLIQQKQQMAPPTQQSRTPVWDEIDKEVNSLSANQQQVLNQNTEYQEQYEEVQFILNREFMKSMRPIVESTPDGKDSLDKLLTLIRRLKKTALEESDKELALFQEYKSNYSHMSFNEFLDMKNGKTKGGKK